MGLCFTIKNVLSFCYLRISIFCILIFILQSFTIQRHFSFSIKYSNLRTANSEMVSHNLSYCTNFHTPCISCVLYPTFTNTWCDTLASYNVSHCLISHSFIYKNIFSVPTLLKLSRIGCGWWNECGGILINSFWKQKLKVHQFPKYSELRVWNCNEFVIMWCTS